VSPGYIRQRRRRQVDNESRSERGNELHAATDVVTLATFVCRSRLNDGLLRLRLRKYERVSSSLTYPVFKRAVGCQHERSDNSLRTPLSGLENSDAASTFNGIHCPQHKRITNRLVIRFFCRHSQRCPLRRNVKCWRRNYQIGRLGAMVQYMIP
jgi:hypothetical protein